MMTETPMRQPHPIVAAVLLCAVVAIPAIAAEKKNENITNKPVGTATRAWLDEQRGDVNRSEPEPYPAHRAARAVQRYETTPGSAAGSGSSGTESRGGAMPAGNVLNAISQR